MFRHQLGWELMVDGDGILLTEVCRSDQEIEDVAAAWKDREGSGHDMKTTAAEQAR